MMDAQRFSARTAKSAKHAQTPPMDRVSGLFAQSIYRWLHVDLMLGVLYAILLKTKSHHYSG